MCFKNGDTLERTDVKIETYARVVDIGGHGFTLRDDEGISKTYSWEKSHLWKKKS